MRYLPRYSCYLGVCLIVFTSCRIFQKAGFEKRRYRPGAYTESSSSPATHTTTHSRAQTDRTVITTAALQQGSDDALTSNLAASDRQTPVQSSRIKLPALYASTEKAITSISFKHELPVIHQAQKEQTGLRHASHNFDGFGSILAYLAGVLLFALVTIGIHALFPAMSPLFVILLSTVISIGLAILISYLFFN